MSTPRERNYKKYVYVTCAEGKSPKYFSSQEKLEFYLEELAKEAKALDPECRMKSIVKLMAELQVSLNVHRVEMDEF